MCFEKFIHEQVETVVDIESGMVQLVGCIGGYTGMALQNRVYGCIRPNNKKM